MADVQLERENSTSAAYGGALGQALSQSAAADRELIAQDNAQEETSNTASDSNTRSSPIWFVIAGSVVAIFWISGVLAFTLGQGGLAGLLSMPVNGLASLGFVAIGPAIFIMLAAILIAEMIRFRSTARYIGAMAARFADPAKATRDDARLMAEAVRTEITNVNGAVEGALARLGAMEQVLGHHSEAFAAVENSARERTDVLINNLRREREAVADLAIVLDQKAADIASAITEQSKMVVAAADIANAHAIDSTKTLEDSAERLTGSAHDATQGAKVIAAKLDDASERLSSTTIALGDASRSLNTTTAEMDQAREHAQESFAQSHKDARALADMTRHSVEEIESVAKQGAEVIANTFESVLKTSQQSVRDVQRETELAAERNTRQSEELRKAAEEARSALDAYAEVIAKRLEQANEASFSAASWADKTFERLEAATQDLERKLAALPQTADAQARDLQDKLRHGLEGLNEAARAAAEEAEEIDAGFQARIRQNYELLSDFMLRMGSAADQRGGAMEIPSPFVAPVREPQTSESVKNAAGSSVVQTKTRSTEAKSNKADAPRKKSFIEAQIEAQNDAREPQGRKDKTRVNSESSKDTEVENNVTSGWRWKDVLSGMDMGKGKPASSNMDDASKTPSEPAPADVQDSLDRLVKLFRIHDIDPPALFNAQVYRSLAHARLVGGKKAMMEVVRLEASAPVAALAADFVDDAQLREVARSFAAELRQKINEAAAQSNKMHLETHLRTGDGPAYLLIEAALD